MEKRKKVDENRVVRAETLLSQMDEGQLVELTNGTLIANMRTMHLWVNIKALITGISTWNKYQQRWRCNLVCSVPR